MRYLLLPLILLIVNFGYGQKLFDSTNADKALLTLPRQATAVILDTSIIRAIEAVDKNYRKIADSLYPYKSLRYTIFQTVPIETNDSVFINPLLFSDRIKTHSIIFNNKSLNSKVDSIAKRLRKSERHKLYSYLAINFDNFSEKAKKFSPQPVRLRYIKFPDNRIVHVGIDIYGEHFLWTVDRERNWDVTKVEGLWIY